MSGRDGFPSRPADAMSLPQPPVEGRIEGYSVGRFRETSLPEHFSVTNPHQRANMVGSLITICYESGNYSKDSASKVSLHY